MAFLLQVTKNAMVDWVGNGTGTAQPDYLNSNAILSLVNNDVICTLRDPRTPDIAKEIDNTRSAAAIRLWLERMAGSVVAIGNAPTALFYLLELLRDGAPKPAAILGMPVGFVGAAESKDALAENSYGVPYAIVRGRLGGSAMTAAAVNALARPGL